MIERIERIFKGKPIMILTFDLPLCYGYCHNFFIFKFSRKKYKNNRRILDIVTSLEDLL